jgi:hypothetical protein
LHVRFASAKAVKADSFACEIDFGTNESMRPKGINEVAMAEQFDFAPIIGATQKDNRSLERKLQVERPVIGKGSSRRSRVEAWCCTTASSLDEALGAGSEGFEVVVLKASPDFVLPSSVVVFDGRLKAGLSRWSEDRDDIELETKADHATESIGPLMGALEEGVVVELGVIEKSVFAPVGDERFDREFGGPGGFDPTGAEAAVEADCIQDHDVGSTANDETFHEVEAVEFGLTGCNPWEVPALGRRRAADTPASIQCAASEEDSTDRAHGGDALRAAFVEGAMNGGCAKLTEIAGLPELFAEPQDEIFEAHRGGTSLAPSSAWRIGPIDTIQTLTVRSSNPVLHRRQTHMKLPMDSSQRTSAAHRRNHPPPSLFNTVFCSQSVLPVKHVFCSIVTGFD